MFLNGWQDTCTSMTRGDNLLSPSTSSLSHTPLQNQSGSENCSDWPAWLASSQLHPLLIHCFTESYHRINFSSSYCRQWLKNKFIVSSEAGDEIKSWDRQSVSRWNGFVRSLGQQTETDNWREHISDTILCLIHFFFVLLILVPLSFSSFLAFPTRISSLNVNSLFVWDHIWETSHCILLYPSIQPSVSSIHLSFPLFERLNFCVQITFLFAHKSVSLSFLLPFSLWRSETFCNVQSHRRIVLQLQLLLV